MPIRRFNPAWLATLDLASTSQLTVRDHAILLEIAGAYADTRLDPAGRGPEIRERLSRMRDGGEGEHRNRVSIADLRSDLRIPALRDVMSSVERLRPVTNGGRAMFAELYEDEGDLVVVPAPNRALIDAHVTFAQRALNKEERWYVNLDVRRVALMSSSISVPFVLRLVAWMRSPTRVGLDDVLQLRSVTAYDEMGRIGEVSGFVRSAQIREILGLCRDGVIPAVADRSKAAVISDAKLLDVTAGWSWRRNGRQVAGMHFHAMGMVDAWAPDVEVEDETPRPRPIRLRGASATATPESQPVDEAHDEVLDRPPPRTRPGRVRLNLVPKAVPAPMPSAPEPAPPVTSSDDVDMVDDDFDPDAEYEWREEDYIPPEQRAASVAAPAPAPVEAASDVDDDEGEPVYDAEGFEIPVTERPHRRPVYDADGRDQHGYDRDGYGRDRIHWRTGLMDDEISPGVKKPGVKVEIRHVGLPPTDRDRWVKSRSQPFCPPPETPHWCAKPGVWMSVRHDQNWDLTRFPLLVWRHGSRHDVDVWSIDPDTLTTVRHHEPVATQVRDWNDIFAYMTDLRVWADERPLDLGDLPADFVIRPGYDLAEVMSHCVR